MATLERPLKEGSVRTYQAKVGLGFLDILAAEVDADLDTIYAAWNGGLADGSVTGAKLATGAVGTRELATNLPSTFLADDSVGVRVIGPLAVGNAELAAGILGSKLADGTVTYAKLDRVQARARQQGALPSIPNNVNTAVSFDTEVTDVGGVFNPAQADRFTVPRDGYYIFGGSAAFASSGTGTRRVLSLTVGGTSIAGSEASQGAVRQLAVASGAALLTGAIIQLFAYQDSGFALGLDVGVLPNIWLVQVG
jgi:hypothetical protein